MLPGKPNESLLIAGVRHANGGLRMPPDGRLSGEDISRLVRWVQEGAHWTGAKDTGSVAADPQQPPAIRGADASFWSFQPVRDVAPPPVQLKAWPQGGARSLHPGPTRRAWFESLSAGRQTHPAPRATFDLTGLPPTPTEMRTFLADDSPEAFAKVVDRLLASPRYGERWGRHWLDVVRYADARDLLQLPVESDFREAWRYRDWVVDAFNRDLPYTEFLTRQIAGDLLQPADPTQIDSGALIATGFLAIADFVPGDVDKEQMIADCVNDQIDVLGKAFLGLTLACARCHDHKFDPISTDDYYALAGIFFSTRLIPGPVKGNTPLVRAPLLPSTEVQAIEAQIAQDKRRVAELGREVQIVSDREHLAAIEHLVTTETSLYVRAASEYRRLSSGREQPALADFAAARQLKESRLARWLKFLGDRPHPAFAQLLAAADNHESTRLAEELDKSLSKVAAQRQTLAPIPQSSSFSMPNCSGFGPMTGGL